MAADDAGPVDPNGLDASLRTAFCSFDAPSLPVGWPPHQVRKHCLQRVIFSEAELS